MLTGSQIRDRFLDYFAQHGHTVVESSSLVPHDDPTLLFSNAGMNQFKDVFLGLDRRPYLRAASSQKCLRAGGKHNDLETVGRTARHHTFFEMLGNFSFGDYFKEEAIGFAWEFLTRELGLPRESLWITVYEKDAEAADLWKKKAAVDPARIVSLGDKDNFWSMGDVGPCGPCSEIIYDRGARYACGEPVCGIGACDCGRWLEIWNLVFMEFERDAQGTMTPLPRPSIDTGMGLERIASVLQGKESNYETDLLWPLVTCASDLTGLPYGNGPEGFALRVIADHARSCTFLICDGILPGNEGRGYVLRRILRRAVRFGKAAGIDGPFLFRFVPLVTEIMGSFYPDLPSRQDHISKVIRVEEERFHETIDSGMQVASGILERLARDRETVVPGRDAFLLYDTFGFPLDLTEDMAGEQGFTVDREGFARAMEDQKEKARAAGQKNGAYQQELQLAGLFAGLEPTEFLGYGSLETPATIRLLAGGDGQRRSGLPAGDEGFLVLDRTPYYAESGGQVGDTGELFRDGVPVARVTDTRRAADGRIYSRIEALEELQEHQAVEAVVDPARRLDVARNHSATHLLHEALRQVLGEHAAQKGSLVTPDRLRFDFHHFAALTPEELEEVERLVNEAIWRNDSVETQEMDIGEARERGAVALFGEKYADRVRVVSMGEGSQELCGGTHVPRTGSIGCFRILAESGIGSGLRRIEALTGRAAHQRAVRESRLLESVSRQVRSEPADLEERVGQLLQDLKARDQEIRELRERLVRQDSKDLLSDVTDVAGVPLLVLELPDSGMADMRRQGDALRERMKDGVLVLGAREGERVNFVVMVFGTAREQGVHAGELVREIAGVAGGGGGGKPGMAQAGGKDPGKLQEALQKAPEFLHKQLQ